MKDVEKVFLVVKHLCESQKKLAEIDCFETIAKETGGR